MNYQEIKNNLKNSVLEHIKNDLETIENELNNIQKRIIKIIIGIKS